MKNVIITGATDGLGKSLFELMYETEQYNFIIMGRSQTKMDNIINNLKKNRSIVVPLVLDLTNLEETKEKVSLLLSSFTTIDYLINNAGANTKKDKILDIDIHDLDYMMKLNCYAPLVMMQLVAPYLKSSDDAKIINILSSCCLFNNINTGSYTASKNAFEALSKILIKELHEENIKVSNVYPGGIDTNFRKNPNHNYLTADSAAKTILTILNLPHDVELHDIVFRPKIEENF